MIKKKIAGRVVYVKGINFQHGRLVNVWLKSGQDKSYYDFRTESDEQMVDISGQPRTPGLDFLDNIKSIRRIDFIDGDVAVLWDQFLLQNIKAEVPLHLTRADGILDSKFTRQDMIDRLSNEFNLKLFIKNIDRDAETQEVGSEVLLLCSSNIQVQLSFWNSEGYQNDIKMDVNGIGLNFISNDLEVFQRMEKICAEFITVKKNAGCIYVLARSGSGGLTLSEAGYAAETLIPENYSEEVMEQYEHMLEDLKSDKPCGRLNVVSGLPGTGKSFLMKALLKHSEDLMFILVRPELVTALGDPEFVAVLINQKDEDKPYVFIVEDADSILTERMSDNMGGISAILNTSDGLLGSTLDLRIIASTNAEKVEFDQAVLRPGRLCSHIEVGKLSTERAHAIFKRETGKEFTETQTEIKSDPNMVKRASKIGFGDNLDSKKGFTLAEVYKAVYLYNKTLGK